MGACTDPNGFGGLNKMAANRPVDPAPTSSKTHSATTKVKPTIAARAEERSTAAVRDSPKPAQKKSTATVIEAKVEPPTSDRPAETADPVIVKAKTTIAAKLKDPASVEFIEVKRAIRPFGVWGAMAGLGVALGPVIGGAVVEWSSWQWIFWINVPIGVLLIPLTLLLRESRGGAGRLDPIGVGLAMTGLFGLVYGIIRGSGHGWTDGLVLAALIGGGLLVVAFLAWQRRAPHPMVPLSMFRSRGYAVANTVSFVMAFGMFGAVFLGAQFLQTVQGYSPLEAGVRTLPWTAVPALAAPISGLLADRFGARWVLAVSLALQAIGIGWLGVVSAPDVPYVQLVPPFVLAGLGMGLFFAPIARVTLGFAPRHLEGVASGTSNALRQLGTVLGIAVLGAVFSAAGGYASGQDFVDGMVAAQYVVPSCSASPRCWRWPSRGTVRPPRRPHRSSRRWSRLRNPPRPEA